MVDLPGPSRNAEPIVTSEAPRSGISPGQVAAPYQELARGLEQGGAALNDVAVRGAEQAGRDAVTKDADGNLVLKPAPLILGDAGAAYTRAANMAYLAQREPQLEDQATQLRLANPDADQFKAKWNAFSQNVIDNAPNPALGSAMTAVLAREGGLNYRALATQNDVTTRENALTGLTSRLTDLNERGGALARQGGVNTPEYAALQADRHAIYTELTTDPRYRYPIERAELEEKQNRDDDQVQAIVGHGVREYQTRKNLAEAQKWFQDQFWGPGSENLNLSAQRRDAGVTEGLRALERVGAQDRAATTSFQESVAEYMKNIQAAPANFDPVAHNSMVAKAKELGDAKSKAQLDAVATIQPLWQSLHGLTPAQANSAVTDLARGVVPAVPTRLADPNLTKLVEDEAKKQNVDPEVAKRIVSIESGGNPGAVSGSYKGLFQLSDDEFAHYGGTGNILDPTANVQAGVASLADKAAAFQQKYGRAPTATELYLAHQQGEGGLAAHLANPDAPAWRNMLSTAEGRQKGEAWAKAAIWDNVPGDMKFMFPAGVESVSSRQFMNAWAQKMQGIPYKGAMVAGESVFDVPNPMFAKLFQSTVAEMREVQGKNAEDLADFIVKQANDRNAVTPDTLHTFATAAVASGKEQLLQKVMPALNAYDAWKGATPSISSAGVLEAQIGAVKAAGTDPVTSQAITSLDHITRDGVEQLQKNPIGAGANRGWVSPPSEVNLNDPQAFATELASRNKKLATVRQMDPALGPGNVLGPGEGEALRTSLTQGDPKAAGALIGTLQQSLSPENFAATMASDPMKAALSGMIRSRDPDRMTAGMAALDALWRQDPWGFKATYGEAALTHLEAWQGLKNSFSAPEIAERLNAADDPDTSAGRKKAKALAEEETKNWTAGDVAYQLGNSWGVPILSSLANPITGATPRVPFDLVQQGALLHDYDSTYTALRTYGVNPDKAKQLAATRVGHEWGPSEVANGQLMKNPPERYYKPLNSSYQWMRDDLEKTITAVRGPAVSMGPTSPFTSNLASAKAALKLTPQEEYLYQRHLYNLQSTGGGIPNPEGGKSTLFQESFEHDGRTYNIPTVWDGKFLSPDEAAKRAAAEGWDKWPSYGSEDEAESRYQKMHAYMEKDLDRYNDPSRNASFVDAGIPEAQITPSYNWQVKGLVPDAQTQAEITAGKPPSYLVALDTGNGLTDFLINPATGQPGRIAWNRDDHLAEMQARFKALDDQRKTEREMERTLSVPAVGL